jgi:hypothetical protein
MTMAAPMDDLTPEQRAEVAADCDKAVELLTTEGWRTYGLWDVTADNPAYQGGPLCAVGALAVAHNEQWMRALPDYDRDQEVAYELVHTCSAGLAVATEIAARRGGETTPDVAHNIWRFNDRLDSPDEVIGLLRDVAAKHRLDETDGGVL